MKESIYCGLMSGSSLDGLDIAVVKFYYAKNSAVEKFKIRYFNTIPFPAELKERLSEAVDLTIKEFFHLENIFSQWCGLVVKTLPQKIYNEIDKIATHGHTVLHNPEIGLTYQLCNGWELAHAAQKPVLSDFRRNDIAHGGQGAPLAPVAEKYLFPQDKIFMNLGGIVNISVHTAEGIKAYDVSPFNQVLNKLAEVRGRMFDDDGRMAKKGKMLPGLAEKMSAHAYFDRPAPKSLDNNWIRNEFLPPILNAEGSIEDKLHTLTHWIADMVVEEIGKFPEEARENEVITTGGGYWNTYFVETLNAKMLKLNYKGIRAMEKTFIDGKEAVLMALMGHLYDRKIPNSLTSVTGASQDTVNGVHFKFKK